MKKPNYMGDEGSGGKNDGMEPMQISLAGHPKSNIKSTAMSLALSRWLKDRGIDNAGWKGHGFDIK